MESNAFLFLVQHDLVAVLGCVFPENPNHLANSATRRCLWEMLLKVQSTSNKKEQKKSGGRKVANLAAPQFFKIPDLKAHGPKPS